MRQKTKKILINEVLLLRKDLPEVKHHPCQPSLLELRCVKGKGAPTASSSGPVSLIDDKLAVHQEVVCLVQNAVCYHLALKAVQSLNLLQQLLHLGSCWYAITNLQTAEVTKKIKLEPLAHTQQYATT